MKDLKQITEEIELRSQSRKEAHDLAAKVVYVVVTVLLTVSVVSAMVLGR